MASAKAIATLALLKPQGDAPFSRKVLYGAQLSEAGAVEDAKLMWQALSRDHPDNAVLTMLAE